MTTDCIRCGANPGEVCRGCYERTRQDLQAARERIASMESEIRFVAELMDCMIVRWGFDGVFRRCLDRLRKLITEVAT